MKSYHNDEKRRKTKERLKSTRSYELIRQEEIERQCEEFFISLDSKDMEVESHEDDGLSNVHTPLIKMKTAPYDVNIVKGTLDSIIPNFVPGIFPHDVQEDVLSPTNLLLDQMMDNPLSLTMGLSLTIVDGETSLGTSEKKQKDGSYFIPRLIVEILLFPCKSDFYSEMVAIAGTTHILFTRHFHYYMLLRLKISLDHVDVVICWFKKRYNGLSFRMYKLSYSENLCYVENFRGLEFHFNEFYELSRRISISGMFMLVFSNWRLINEGEMSQFASRCPILASDCPVLKVMDLWVDVDVNHNQTCLGLGFLIGLLNASFRYDLNGVWNRLVLSMNVNISCDNSSNNMRLLRAFYDIYSRLSFSLSDYMLQMFAHYVRVVKIGLKPPWSRGDVNHIEIRLRKYLNGPCANQGAALTSNLVIPKVSMNNPFMAFLTVILRPRYFILVFDPGGEQLRITNHLRKERRDDINSGRKACESEGMSGI